MSSYSETSARSTSARPATLTAAMGVAIVSGIAAIANGVVILAGGLDLIKELGNRLIAKELGVSEAEVSATLGSVGLGLDELYKKAQDTYTTRAWMVLVFGAALLVFGLLMRKAAIWTQILVTLSAALVVIFAGVIATDLATGTMKALGWLALVGSLVAIVLTWLPANRRYAKAFS